MTHETRRQTSGIQSGFSPKNFGLAIGGASVIAGGFVAALTEPLQLAKGSWAAAYLVLVMGVAQIILAEQRRLLLPDHREPRTDLAVLLIWTFGNFGVLIGSLQNSPITVDIGGVALALAVVGALWRTRGAKAVLLAWAFRLVLLVVLLSIPVGLVLAHLRA